MRNITSSTVWAGFLYLSLFGTLSLLREENIRRISITQFHRNKSNTRNVLETIFHVYALTSTRIRKNQWKESNL